MYIMMEDILLKSVCGTLDNNIFSRNIPEIGSFVDLYSKDINMNLLKVQLSLLPALATNNGDETSSMNILNAIEIIRKEAQSERKSLIGEVIILTKLILISLATNAESERIFSALSRLKTGYKMF